jgi:hydroxymethylbilane synthase
MPAIETNGLKTDTFLKRNDPREILITVDKKKIKRFKFKINYWDFII